MLNLKKSSLPHQQTAVDEAPITSSEKKLPIFTRRVRGVRNLWRRSRRVLLALFAATFIVHASLNLWATLQLNRELATLRSKGEPLTLPEMMPATIADSQNAAILYQKADAALTPTVKKKLKSGQPRRLKSQIRDGTSKWLTEEDLRQNQKVVTLLRQAAVMEQCRFPVDWSNPVAALFPHLPMMRNLARLMSAQAGQEAHAGKQAQAMADVRVIFQMSRHLSHSPTLIESLVSLAIESMAYGTLRDVLKVSRITPQEGGAILQSLPFSDWPQVFQHAMQTERAFGLWFFETLRNDPSQYNGFAGNSNFPEPSLWQRPLWFIVKLLWSPISKLDELHYLRLMQQAIVHPTQPAFTSKTSAGEEERRTHNLPAYAVITRLVSPTYSQLSLSQEQGAVRRRMAEVAVAVACYRTTVGHYPETLDVARQAWDKALPLDPYSGMAFIYKPEQDSYVLYCVGPNRKDDGGRRHNPTGADDITWFSPAQ